MFSHTLRRLGIECIYIDKNATDEEIGAAFQPNTKAVFGETIANPALTVFDIERFAAIAHKHGVPLIVDNTFAAPVLCKPFEFGAHIIVHSTSEYMDGHAGFWRLPCRTFRIFTESWAGNIGSENEAVL